jgi:hypothetical protein
MENEIWKDIEGYEGRYQVSNLGRVRSKDMVLPCVVKGIETTRVRRGVIRKSHIGHTGYHYVLLRGGDKYKNFRLHRLVAKAFVPNPDNLPEVNHKDENKNNNRADNLEWCSSSYNHCYGTTIERAADKIRCKVLQIDKNGEVIHEYKSVTAAAKAVGTSSSQISRCCMNLKSYVTAKGYRWRYAEE